MEHIIGKIVDVKTTYGGYIIFEIGEHTGLFKPIGKMRLMMDKRAAFDVTNSFKRITKKGGHIIGPVANTFKGRKIIIQFEWL